MKKRMLLEALYVVSTALCLSLSAWLFAPPPRPAVPASGGIVFQEIDQYTLKLIVADDPHLLLDARPVDSYAEGHIPGAVSLPAYDFTERFNAMKSQFKPGQTTLIYCSSTTCRDADLLAQELAQNGVSDILIYRGGYADWMETGNPVVQGERP